MKIPQMTPWLGQLEADAVAAAVLDNWITEGPRSAEFARRLNELIGVPYGVFAPNGTLALVLGLLAIGIEPGDEIIIPNTTFVASAMAAVMVGAIPVLVDVEPATFQIDVTQAEKRVTSKTKAIMPVHLYGTACDMDAVAEFASRHGLLVIEDAAQGIGVRFKGRHLGSLSDVGCFSFFADKTLTTGEGGYVVTSDPRLYEKLRFLRNQGRLERGSFVHPEIGFNFRITDLQAAIGLVQLDKLGEVIARKTSILEGYREGLAGVKQVRILGSGIDSNHVPFRCVIMTPDARVLEQHLEKNGIEARTFFYPLHRQPSLRQWVHDHCEGLTWCDSDFPVSIQGYEEGLCLPIFPTLSGAEIAHICRVIREFHA